MINIDTLVEPQDFIGYKVFVPNLKLLGMVIGVETINNTPLLQIKNTENKEDNKVYKTEMPQVQLILED